MRCAGEAGHVEPHACAGARLPEGRLRQDDAVRPPRRRGAAQRAWSRRRDRHRSPGQPRRVVERPRGRQPRLRAVDPADPARRSGPAARTGLSPGRDRHPACGDPGHFRGRRLCRPRRHADPAEPARPARGRRDRRHPGGSRQGHDLRDQRRDRAGPHHGRSRRRPLAARHRRPGQHPSPGQLRLEHDRRTHRDGNRAGVAVLEGNHRIVGLSPGAHAATPCRGPARRSP